MRTLIVFTLILGLTGCGSSRRPTQKANYNVKLPEGVDADSWADPLPPIDSVYDPFGRKPKYGHDPKCCP